MAKERGFRGGKSLSLCPGSKKAISKLPKQAMTTVGSKKTLEKDDRVISAVQPRKLFNKEGEKTGPVKKPVRAGRVVASRYNNTSSNQAMNENAGLRKRSLPENDDSKGNEKKRASLGQKSCSKHAAAEQQHGRVKKKWDIPTEVVMYNGSVDVNDDQIAVPVRGDDLPKIRTVRCFNETRRDSGAVKRAAELTDKKVFCGDDEDGKQVVRQALNFAEEEAEKDELAEFFAGGSIT